MIPRSIDDVVETRCGSAASTARRCSRAAAARASPGQTLQRRGGDRLLEVPEPDRSRSTPSAQLARVEPGVDPRPPARHRPSRSTASPSGRTRRRTQYCTLGGMIGNNSCGVRSMMAAVHGPARAAPTTSTSSRCCSTTAGGCAADAEGTSGDARGDLTGGCVELRDRYADLIRERYPDRSRAASRATTSTSCCRRRASTWRARWSARSSRARRSSRATLKLIPKPPCVLLLAVGYPDKFRIRRPRHDRARARADLDRGDGRDADRGHDVAGHPQAGAIERSRLWMPSNVMSSISVASIPSIRDRLVLARDRDVVGGAGTCRGSRRRAATTHGGFGISLRCRLEDRHARRLPCRRASAPPRTPFSGSSSSRL